MCHHTEWKNFFEQFDGDHLQFSLDDFDRWVTTYLSVRGGDNSKLYDEQQQELQVSIH